MARKTSVYLCRFPLHRFGFSKPIHPLLELQNEAKHPFHSYVDTMVFPLLLEHFVLGLFVFFDCFSPKQSIIPPSDHSTDSFAVGKQSYRSKRFFRVENSCPRCRFSKSQRDASCRRFRASSSADATRESITAFGHKVVEHDIARRICPFVLSPVNGGFRIFRFTQN